MVIGSSPGPGPVSGPDGGSGHVPGDVPGHATGPGVVSFVGTRSGYGRGVEIDHGRGLVTRYAHASRALVRLGQHVRQATRALADDVVEMLLDIGWAPGNIALLTTGNRHPEQVSLTLSADVDIETKTHTNVIKVPTQAVMGRPLEDLPAALFKGLDLVYVSGLSNRSADCFPPARSTSRWTRRTCSASSASSTP